MTDNAEQDPPEAPPAPDAAALSDAVQPDTVQPDTVQPDTVPPDAAEPRAAPAARRVRRSGYVLWRILVLSFSAVMAVVIAVPVLMIGQEVRAPSWVAHRMEEQASAALDGGALEFGSITVTFGTDFHPRLRMTQTVLRNAQGRLLARVPGIDVLVSPRGLLLRGELLVQEVVLSGAQLTLDRGRDGTFALALGNDGAVFGQLDPDGPAEPAPETTASVSPAAQGLGSLVSFMEGITQRPTLEALEHVTAEGLIINYNDARAGRSWTVDGGRIDLDLAADNLHFGAHFTLLSGRAYVTELVLAYDSAPNTHVAQVSLELQDAAARDIASQSPALEWLKPVDAPVSLRLNATLDENGRLADLTGGFRLGRGRVQKADGDYLAFDSVNAALQFEPDMGENGVLRFDQVELRSAWASVSLQGEAYLGQITGGAPSQLSGQIRLLQGEINPPGLYAQPLVLAEGYVDYRLQLAPLRLDIASLVLVDSAPSGPDAPPARLIASGQFAQQEDGWQVSTQARIAEIGVERLLALWPPGWKTPSRVWVEASIPQGLMRNVQLAVRRAPGQPPQVQVSHEFVDATVRFMPTLPPIRGAGGYGVFDGRSYIVVADAGSISPPQGGAIDVAGTVFSIPDTRVPEPPSRVELHTRSTVTAALSILDQPPFGFLTRAGQPVTLADGRAVVSGVIEMPLKRPLPADEVDFDISARLTGLRSDTVVPDHVLTADALRLHAVPTELTLEGPVRIGDVSAEGQWSLPIGAGQDGTSVLQASVVLSEQFLQEFSIALPPGSLSGVGQGDLRLDLPAGQPPRFALRSNLRGLSLRIPQLGWGKGARGEGNFQINGTLAAVPRIDQLLFNAAGLQAEGTINLTPSGAFERARFSRVRLNGWLDVAADLVARGTAAPRVVLRGGTLNFGRSEFNSTGGEGSPMEVVLDRLQVSEDIALTGFSGSFDANFSGQFTARVNGGTEVAGTAVPQGTGVSLRVTSADAGRVLRDAGFLDNAHSGQMELLLTPTGAEGTYDGELMIERLRIRDAPALASLLDAISVIGLLQQLDGQGLSFSEVRATFRMTPEGVTVSRSSAVGPGLGLSLDGYYRHQGQIMDFQGVISPLYLINGLGAIFTRRGEGLIGFNFKLTGPFEDARVVVNPLSALTPGMFREIFRRPVPVLDE